MCEARREGRPAEVALMTLDFAASSCAVFVADAEAYKEADSLLAVARALLVLKVPPI